MEDMNQREIKRGEIYYIEELESGVFTKKRPWVIVGNDLGNKSAKHVIAAPMTATHKRSMGTHVKIYSSPRPSTVCCEDIQVVLKSQVREYVGTATEEEMRKIERAILFALGMERESKPGDALILEPNSIIIKDEKPPEVIRLEAERDIYKSMCKELLEKLG